MTELGLRTFVLNADDFAMDPGVDAAILELADRGIVTSASALVLSPNWPGAGKDLAAAAVSRGLHLDFTSPFVTRDFTEGSITAIVTRAYSGLLGRRQIRDLIERQLSLYEDAIGTPPEFVDGHQHVHQLPLIRGQLLDCLRQRYGDGVRGIRLRSCRPRKWRGLEAFLVAATGGYALERLAAKAGCQMNTDFAGVYSFSLKSDLKRLWRSWLETVSGPSPLIMCHPAKDTRPPRNLPDRITMARAREYSWLSSGEFRELCLELRATPVQWKA